MSVTQTRKRQTAATVPPLENGDRLTRAEFERRYHAMPHVKKAELIEGVVYMPSPVHYRKHGRPHAHIVTWLGTYEAVTPHVELSDNTTVRLDGDNEPQPDVLLRIARAAGGASVESEDDYIEGPPELVIEVAASSASYDLHDKRHVYRRNGVKEYIVWLMLESQLTWFYLDEGVYKPLEAKEGVIHSRTFPGLCLKVGALLNGDLAGVLSTLQGCLGGEEHRAFVEGLGETRGG